MTAPIRPVMLKIESRNSRSGMMGSAARCSTATKSSVVTTAPAVRPRIVREPQAYYVPPQLVTRTRQVEAAASNTAPSTSSRGRTAGFGSFSTTAMTTNVTSPNGTLM